ncbi:hypothetical protein GWI33_007580 [Rhynchophorus ferrugineus]|uniref:Uncharacterized protein n=1 Tax=Rhynchophorus ferrugineus TaxID=354439 RepID=A0A834IG01_RHYFE|nr:hypothetical protein GWI33_007580 [Rhynchophorus ferrugineus]
MRNDIRHPARGVGGRWLGLLVDRSLGRRFKTVKFAPSLVRARCCIATLIDDAGYGDAAVSNIENGACAESDCCCFFASSLLLPVCIVDWYGIRYSMFISASVR